MRKTRFLAFSEAQQIAAGHSGIGVGFRGTGMPPALPLLQYRSLRAGDAGVRARCARGRSATPQTSIVDGGNHSGRWSSRVDDRHRRTDEVPARRRQRARQLVATFVLAAIGLGQPGDDQRSGLARRCES